MTQGRRVYTGLNVRYPWSALLASGAKTVETRSYPIPPRLKNADLALIETKNGPAQTIAFVAFSGSREYATKEEWAKDRRGHLVGPDDPMYGWKEGRPKHGWVVGKVTRLLAPCPVKSLGRVYRRVEDSPCLASAASEREARKNPGTPYSDPALWERAKREAVDRLGGRHSARAMQVAGRLYREAGGGYAGPRTASQKSLSRWTAEDWTTATGAKACRTTATGVRCDRYLPRAAWSLLTPAEAAATRAVKVRSREQYVPNQPEAKAAGRLARAAKQGGATRRLPRSNPRPIRQDDAALERLIDHLYRWFAMRAALGGYQRINDSTQPEVIAQETTSVRTVRGDLLDVAVLVTAARSGTGVINGAVFGTVKGQPTLMLEVNGRLKWDELMRDAGARASIRSTIAHELSHAADVFAPKSASYREGKAPRGGGGVEAMGEGIDLDAYVNHPGEVRAFMREIYEDIAPTVKALRATEVGRRRGIGELVSRLLDTNGRWQMLDPHITPRNRARLLSGIVRALEEAEVAA